MSAKKWNKVDIFCIIFRKFWLKKTTHFNLDKYFFSFYVPNIQAMRDLSGRRQRDVNNERRLKEYIAGTAEREKVKEENKEKKLEKLRLKS